MRSPRLADAGFCCLESVSVRSKNSINVAVKNLMDFGLSSMLFWTAGFAIMFGASFHGLAGTSGFFFNASSAPNELTFFLFQLLFCGTATTIVSGAVAERMGIRGYVLVSAVVSVLVYPVFGHWAWAGPEGGSAAGWLKELGFIDFAGSTVVHSVGGWVALAAVVVVGPRLGRFGKDGGAIHGHNLPLATVGTLLLWFGWLGFNGGSTLALTGSVPLILLNTTLSGAAGGISALGLSWRKTGLPDVPQAMNGVLAGLVGITASCNIVTPVSAVLIGTAAGAICFLVTTFLEKLHIDDVVGAVPVHGFAGVWGTLAVALFADPAKFGTGFSRWEQLLVQATGAAAAFIWAFGVGFLFVWLVNRRLPLRVSSEDERRGLNIAEHGATTEILDLLQDMEQQARSGDFAEQVHVEPHTEVGQVASQYNRVLDKVCSEIEQHQESRAALAESEQLMKMIIDTALDAVVNTYSEGRITDWNPRAETIFGWPRSEALSRDLPATIIPSKFRKAYEKGLRRYLATGKGLILNKRVEIIAMRRDETEFPAELTVSALHVNGRVCFSAFVRDITERKNGERELAEARDKALESSRLKSEFLANMSHEIRTPMNGIIGMAGLLLDTEQTAEQREFAETIAFSSESLLTIINDILDFSKIEAGRMTVEAAPFDLHQTVEAVAELLSTRAGEKGLELVVRFASDTPRRVVGDSGRFRQVLTNLVGNAVKFTDRGHVLIDVSPVNAQQDNAPPVNAPPDDAPLLDQAGADAVIRLSVEDTGIGIPAKKLDDIFGKFTQADASTTRKYGGTGLGLAISKRLVELMNGEVGVSSHVGEGSTFWFTFRTPVSKAAEPSEAAQHSMPAHTALSGLRTLIVDDNRVNLHVLAELLSRMGLKTCCAPSGQEALDELQSARQRGAPYDLAVVDHHMPEMTGLELGRAIQSDQGLFDSVATVLLSSLANAASREEIQQAGFAASLTKPVRASALMNTLSAAWAARQQHSPEQLSNLQQATSVGRKQGRPDPDPKRAALRILLAEDNLVNQKVAVRMLEKLGCQVDVAGDGRKAVEMSARGDHHLILMDCQMPELDGYQATAEIRQSEGSRRRLPIIAMTANAMTGDREKCLAAGMDDYASKPIQLDTLRDVLERWGHGSSTE